jgi:hypothetical protein
MLGKPILPVRIEFGEVVAPPHREYSHHEREKEDEKK